MAEQLPSPSSHWLADLAFETALGYFTPEELCIKHNLTPERYAVIQATTDFKKAVQLYRRQIDEEGQQFRVKARRMASEVLDVLFFIAADSTASCSDRIAAVTALCKYAGFDKGAEASTSNVAFAVNIRIN